jgi:dTDP-4-dehydrorhamnose reductase
MVRVVVIGCHGRLGAAISRQVSGKFEVFGVGRQPDTWLPNGRFFYYRQDASDRKALLQLLKRLRPHWVINTTGFSDVDGCEDARGLAHQINVQLLQNIILATKRVGASLMHISSDQIFDGTKIGFYTEQDRPNPLNFYGRTQWIAENIIRASGMNWSIIRTSTLCTRNSDAGPTNLVGWLEERFSRSQPVEMPTDEFRNPTCVENLAGNIWKLLRVECNGVYHLAGRSSISLYDFSRRIAMELGYDPELVRPRGYRAAVRARRPKNCALSTIKAETDFNANLYAIDDTVTSVCEHL